MHTAIPWLNLAMNAACLAALIIAWRALRGVTLRVCVAWAVLAVSALAASDALVELTPSSDSQAAETWRYAAAALLFCPTMALFGAKRPQLMAWQFVVLAFWIMLALPAIEVWLRGRGEIVSIDPIRSWFLVALIATGAVNHLPTRFAMPALLLAAAQGSFVWRYLPWTNDDARLLAWIGPTLLLASALAAWFIAGRTKRPSDNSPARQMRGLNAAWSDFRDGYGLVWAMRVMERINAQAAKEQWPVRLAWEEFVVVDQAAAPRESPANDPELPGVRKNVHAIDRPLRALLRRFVSGEWIDRRLFAAD